MWEKTKLINFTINIILNVITLFHIFTYVKKILLKKVVWKIILNGAILF